MTVPTGVISKAKTAAQGIQGDVFVYNSPITSGVNGDLKFVEAVFKGK